VSGESGTQKRRGGFKGFESGTVKNFIYLEVTIGNSLKGPERKKKNRQEKKTWGVKGAKSGSMPFGGLNSKQGKLPPRRGFPIWEGSARFRMGENLERTTQF